MQSRPKAPVCIRAEDIVFQMKSSHDRLIRLIALFKLLKATLLVAVGMGAFKLLHQDISSVMEHWIEALKLDPGNRFIDTLLAKASNLNPAQIKELGLGSLLYAGLFLTEGIGLWMLKRWAEWLTIIITSSLVPIEIYEILRHPSPGKVAVFIINVGIVGYLVYGIRTRPPVS
jgi:uncharacterized membrane protein (DUF2068 family)